MFRAGLQPQLRHDQATALEMKHSAKYSTRLGLQEAVRKIEPLSMKESRTSPSHRILRGVKASPMYLDLFSALPVRQGPS
jgi:hypothetical protein